MKSLLAIFVFTMFLLNGLSPIPIASFNFFIAAAALPFLLLRPIPAIYNFKSANLSAAAIFAWGVFAWILFPAPVEISRMQGALQWAASLIVLWFGVRRMIIVSKISFIEISHIAMLSSATLAGFVIFEFILTNTRGLFLSDLIPFSIDTFPEADVFFTGITRPRGFAAEAGFTSMVFEALVPISALYFTRVKLPLQIAYAVAVAIALLLLFSTTTFFALALTLIFFAMIRNNVRGVVPIMLIFGGIAYGIALNADFFFSAAGYKIYEFFDAGNYYNTSGSRQEAWATGLNVFLKHPFGSGWGTILQEAKSSGSEIDMQLGGTGLISMWLELLVAVGFAPFLLFGIWLMNLLLKLARSRLREANLCFISLMTLTIHHFAVYEVWFPMFWFVLALSQVVLAASREMPQHPVPQPRGQAI
ncbi:MAG: hypothetical protein JST16_10620 [Bdellovibrionales bacterium]|nr:hypothetical protein [Bdellovibrionales bacterium]